MKDNTREEVGEMVARFGSRFTYRESHELHGDFIYPYPVPMVQAWLLEEIPKAIHQQLQKAREEEVSNIIADYMEALGTVQLPQEVWLWIADINGKYLNKTLKENI